MTLAASVPLPASKAAFRVPCFLIRAIAPPNVRAIRAACLWYSDRVLSEDLGRSSFRVAAGHQVARRCALNEVFEKLADGFRDIRLALNHLSDSLLHLDTATAPLLP